MKNRKYNTDVKLDDYEQEVSNAIDLALDNSMLKSVSNLKEEIEFAQKVANNFLARRSYFNANIRH